MNLIWEKKGLIFKTSESKSWSKTHTTHPIPCVLDENILRIFYTSRDYDHRSRISFIDVDRKDFKKILYVHEEPIFDLGKLGTYDDRGNTSSFVLKKGEESYFYISGYNTANTARYRVGIGLAVGKDNLNFKKISDGPIMDRSINDPCGAATPYIIFENGVYKMWYTSFYKWEMIEDFPEPFYRIRHAVSKDAIYWQLHDTISIDLLEDEGGIVRPSVIKIAGIYHMFYSVRKRTGYREGENITMSYRIGMSISRDGVNWERKDENAGITLSDKGWDSEMQAYPFAFELDNSFYLLYNGNGFGKSGFGYAKLKLSKKYNRKVITPG